LKPDNDDNTELYGKNVSPRAVILEGKAKAPAATQPFMDSLRRH